MPLRAVACCLRLATLSAVMLAGLILPGRAAAATISNHDVNDQTITIVEGDASTDNVLKPQQILDKVCLKGCVVRLNGNADDEYEIAPEDVVTIEDGFMYYDGPEPPVAAPPPEKH
jgi:hypothetical protein